MEPTKGNKVRTVVCNGSTNSSLERAINLKLSAMSNYEVLDIKYSSAGNQGNVNSYSALIIYRAPKK